MTAPLSFLEEYNIYQDFPTKLFSIIEGIARSSSAESSEHKISLPAFIIEKYAFANESKDRKNKDYLGKERYDSLWHACSVDNNVALPPDVFSSFVRVILKPFCSSDVLEMLKDEHLIYFNFHKKNAAKSNRFHGPLTLSNWNASERLNDLCKEFGAELAALCRQPRDFHDFLYKSIERHACADNFALAIKNARAICNVMAREAGKHPFNLLSNDAFYSLLSSAASLGAWASATVGQIPNFNFFHKVVDQCAGTRTKTTILVKALIDGHASDMRSSQNGRLLDLEPHIRGFQIISEVRHDFITEILSSENLIYGNLVDAAIHNGYGVNSKIPDFGKTVGYGIHLSQEAKEHEYYEQIFTLATHASWARAFLNEKDLGSAETEKNKMSAVLCSPDFEFKTMGQAKFWVVAGQFEQALTGERRNKYLEAAFDTYREVKNFKAMLRVNQMMAEEQ